MKVNPPSLVSSLPVFSLYFPFKMKTVSASQALASRESLEQKKKFDGDGKELLLPAAVTDGGEGAGSDDNNADRERNQSVDRASSPKRKKKEEKRPSPPLTLVQQPPLPIASPPSAISSSSKKNKRKKPNVKAKNVGKYRNKSKALSSPLRSPPSSDQKIKAEIAAAEQHQDGEGGKRERAQSEFNGEGKEGERANVLQDLVSFLPTHRRAKALHFVHRLASDPNIHIEKNWITKKGEGNKRFRAHIVSALAGEFLPPAEPQLRQLFAPYHKRGGGRRGGKRSTAVPFLKETLTLEKL